MPKVYYGYDYNDEKYVTVINTALEKLIANRCKEKYTK